MYLQEHTVSLEKHTVARLQCPILGQKVWFIVKFGKMADRADPLW